MINKYFILSLAFFSTNNLRVVYANPLEGKEEITSKEILQNCVGKESSIRCVQQAKKLLEETSSQIQVQTGISLLEQSCELKEAKACIELGYLYQKGKIVNQDELVSQKYFHLGCEYGDGEGCDNEKKDLLSKIIFIFLFFLPIIGPIIIILCTIGFSCYAWKKSNTVDDIEE